MTRTASRPSVAAALLALVALAVPVLVTTAEAAPVEDAPTVLSSRVIGTSVQGREIRAYRLGDPTSPPASGSPRVCGAGLPCTASTCG